jgi:hypothetical protein
LSSLGVRRPLTFHILIFSCETSRPNEVKQTEGETTQGSKEKGQKDKQGSTKHTYKTKDRIT